MFEWGECSGAVLAMMLADRMAGVPEIPDNLDGDAELFSMARGARRVRSWSVAIEARCVATAYERALAEHRRFGLVSGGDARSSAAGPSHRYDDVAYTRSEIAANVALEMGITLPLAEQFVGFALGMARQPEIWVALATGRIDDSQAAAVVAELVQVADGVSVGRIVRSLLTPVESADGPHVLVRELRSGRKRVWDLPPGELRRIIRREAAVLDPESTRVRAERARLARHLRYHQLSDGMAELVLHGPAELLSAAHRRVSEMARAARRQAAPDDHRTLDQLRHDVAVDGLAGAGEASPSGPPPALVNVTVGATTLLGLDELPGTVHGPAGPTEIPADLARELAYRPEQATWRRILCDPATGVAVDVSPRYQSPPRIAEYVRVRDGFRSRFPVPGDGHRFELDHVQRFDHRDPAAGGQTTAANLATGGLREHHLKTDGAIVVSGDANMTLTYRGRAGRSYASEPYQYLEPQRRPDPSERHGPPERHDLPERRHDSPEGPDPPF